MKNEERICCRAPKFCAPDYSSLLQSIQVGHGGSSVGQASVTVGNFGRRKLSRSQPARSKAEFNLQDGDCLKGSDETLILAGTCCWTKKSFQKRMLGALVSESGNSCHLHLQFSESARSQMSQFLILHLHSSFRQ